LTTDTDLAAPRFSVRSWWSTAGHRFLPPALITCILIGSQISFGILEGLSKTALAIAVAVGAEAVLGWLDGSRKPNFVSGYITGISVGILIRSLWLWPYALCSAVSILSKYVIRWRGRHLWNPSNLGVCAIFFLAPEMAAGLSIQWGNAVWVMLVIWVFGWMAVWRVKRLHICLTYVVSFLALGIIRSLVTGQAYLAGVAPITGPMYQLFIFFMITDPKTTVKTRRGQCGVAFSLAAVEAVLRLYEQVYAPFYALFLVGPFANAAEVWLETRGAVSKDGGTRGEIGG
jgi:Na+-translocating ferredoxin:NAD+ oxidoreductase RnfD subunit